MPALRALLRQHPDGLTAKQLLEWLPLISKVTVVKSSLGKMPDVYIDRWTMNTGARGQHEAVWCVVEVPPHCPHPTDRFYAPRTEWAEPAKPNAFTIPEKSSVPEAMAVHRIRKPHAKMTSISLPGSSPFLPPAMMGRAK